MRQSDRDRRELAFRPDLDAVLVEVVLLLGRVLKKKVKKRSFVAALNGFNMLLLLLVLLLQLEYVVQSECPSLYPTLPVALQVEMQKMNMKLPLLLSLMLTIKL